MASPLERLRMNPREQRLVQILIVVLGVMVVVGLPLGVQTVIWSRRSDNEAARAALEAVQRARGDLRVQQAKKDAVTSRYATKAPALAGFIEQAARAQKLEVTSSADRPEVPLGKRYTERATSVKLKKAGMYPIAKFLEHIESSGYPVSLSRLNVRKRSNEPDSFDVDLTVSAYDRKDAPVPAAKKDTKEKDTP